MLRMRIEWVLRSDVDVSVPVVVYVLTRSKTEMRGWWWSVVVMGVATSFASGMTQLGARGQIISVTSAVRLKITLLLRVERLRMISTRVVSGVVPVVSVFSQASLCLSPWASIEYSGVWEAMGSE